MADIQRGHCDWRFHPVSARPFVSIRADVRDDADPMPRLLSAIANADVDDAVVRVIVQARAEQEGLIRDADVRSALKGAYYIASIGKEIERAYRQRLGGDSPEELTPAELLTRYLESRETPPERIEVLLQHAEDIFRTEA